VAAYHVLRAFSWQLRLAPFPLADWCAALAAPQHSPLLDEAHLALVRLLAQDESKVLQKAKLGQLSRESRRGACQERVQAWCSSRIPTSRRIALRAGGWSLMPENPPLPAAGHARGAGAGPGAAGFGDVARLRVGVAALHGCAAARCAAQSSVHWHCPHSCALHVGVASR
jgi:DDT domain